MLTASRVIRRRHDCSLLPLLRRPADSSAPVSRDLHLPRSPPTRRISVLRGPRPLVPRRAALDPLTFAVAVAVSTAVAYVASGYSSHGPSPSSLSSSSSSGEASDGKGASAPSGAQTDGLTMASAIPPGRPGNLTPDQEAKLKEMWVATLDVFGVAHEPTHEAAHANGTASASTEATGDGKKKRKSRLSMFRKSKDSGEAGDGSNGGGGDGDNDKHGQTKEFQQALASQTPEQLRDAFWSMTKHDHPDALLLRFLRARKWDVQAALVMLISTMHWRSAEMRVDADIMLRGEGGALSDARSSDASEKKEGEDFLAQLRLGKSFLHGTDKDGRPCCYVRVRLHRQGEQSEKSLERFTVYTIETARMQLRPPVDTATIVFDMTDFSMANMDYTPVKFMIKCFEANYPESLGSVLVYKSPWIFQGIWKIIRGWLDPVVASKVHFASHVDDLQEWIPRGQIMKELGGDEDWTYAYVEPEDGVKDVQSPSPGDAAAREKITDERRELVKSYESETLAWVHGDDAGHGRARLAERLAENYWRLDPYVRARSLYDRTGVIGPGGKLDFYPSKQQQDGRRTGDDGGGGGGEDELD